MRIMNGIPRRPALAVIGVAIAAFLTLGCLIAKSEAQPSELQSTRAKQIEELVNKAAQLVNAKGSAAFDEFAQKGSQWFKDDTYIFVQDMKGLELFNAAFPNAVGRNFLDQKDKNGKLIVREIHELLQKQDAGWVDYMWPRPSTNEVAKKWTYIKRAAS